MAWAAALGSVIGSGSEGMASAAQYQASKHERNIQWKRMQAWELMAPSLRMEGLKNAGLNPALAVIGGGPGGGHGVTPGMASTGSSPSFDKDSVGRAIHSAKAAKMMDDQIEIVRQQKLQEQEKTRQEVQHSNILERYGMTQAREELSAIQAVIQNHLAGYLNTSASTRRTNLESMLLETQMPGAKAIEEMYQRYPLLRQMKEAGSGGLTSGTLGLGVLGGAKANERFKRFRDKIRETYGFGSRKEKKR